MVYLPRARRRPAGPAESLETKPNLNQTTCRTTILPRDVPTEHQNTRKGIAKTKTDPSSQNTTQTHARMDSGHPRGLKEGKSPWERPNLPLQLGPDPKRHHADRPDPQTKQCGDEPPTRPLHRVYSPQKEPICAAFTHLAPTARITDRNPSYRPCLPRYTSMTCSQGHCGDLFPLQNGCGARFPFL